MHKKYRKYHKMNSKQFLGLIVRAHAKISQ